jgi:hypothetical protein
MSGGPPFNLRPGWEAKYDQATAKYFFIDHVNKKTQWTVPSPPSPAAPPAGGPPFNVAGWERKWDQSLKRYFYIDHVNKKTQWTVPTAPTATSPAAYAARSSNAASSPGYTNSSSGDSDSVASEDAVMADEQIVRRLQLKFNATSSSQKSAIKDVLISCHNNERETENILEAMGFAAKQNISKPKMATPKNEELSASEKKMHLDRLRLRYGDKHTVAEIKAVAEKCKYKISAIQTELSKPKPHKPLPSKPAAVPKAPSVNVVLPAAEGSKKAVVAGKPTPTPKAQKPTTPAKPRTKSADTRQPKKNNERSRSSSASAKKHCPSTRGTSLLANGPDSSLCSGPDASLRRSDSMSVKGCDSTLLQGSRCSLARGVSVEVFGHNPNLANGPRLIAA